MELQEALEYCLQTQWKGTAGEVTAQANADCAVAFFGGSIKLEAITTQKVAAYVQELSRAGNSPATCNRKLSALSKVLRVAFDSGHLKTWSHFHFYKKEPRGRSRWLTYQEQADVVAVLRSRGMGDHADAVEVLAATGLRTSELWRVKLADISGGDLLIPITKSGRPRMIPLSARAREIVISRRVDEDGHVFPFDNAWINYGWRTARRVLNMAHDKEFVVHSLRHTCASRLVQADVPLFTVQQWLGHSSPVTANRYAHLSTQTLRAALNKLEDSHR